MAIFYAYAIFSDKTKRLAMMALKILGELALLGAIASVFVIAAQGRAADMLAEESSGREYMMHLDKESGKRSNKLALANWVYSSNITAKNQAALMEVQLEVAEKAKEAWGETVTYDWHEYADYELRRMYEKYSVLGQAALPEDLNARLIEAVSNMETNYATARICSYSDPTKCDLAVEPDITNIFATSEDSEELKYTWSEWHRIVGTASKSSFTEYVSLKNEAATLNKFDNVASWWLSVYEQDGFETQLADLWDQVKPLYQQIHAYVRRKLREKYGEELISAKGPIPAHLLGNIWAQTWTNIESYTRPYPNKSEVDVTGSMLAQNFTAKKMFKMADEFFVSLNLTSVPKSFWKKSILEKPTDGRDLVCHASAWDFFDGEDFRVKQCTSITSSFLTTTHHEMGHIQYYMQYKDLPIIFREGANPGFHEAVGDVIALSVSTPKHLRQVGLLDSEEDDDETEVNQLFRMGLEKIVFLPFGYLMDVYRYSVFRGITPPEDYNCHFWQMREALQGVQPPVERTEDDFDPAAKYHISADVEYMRHTSTYMWQGPVIGPLPGWSILYSYIDKKHRQSGISSRVHIPS